MNRSRSGLDRLHNTDDKALFSLQIWAQTAVALKVLARCGPNQSHYGYGYGYGVV